MAPKKSTAFEQPPRASSSEEEEDEVSNEEAEEDASDESDEEEEVEDTPKAEKRVVHVLKPESSSEDDGSDSGSDEDSPVSVAKPPDLSVKPAAAKPAAEVQLGTTKLKLKQPASAPAPASVPASAPAVTIAVLGKKRSGESKTGGKDSKKSKKVADVEDRRVVVDEEVKKVGEDSKKQLFQRLFSEEDEIEVLKGMLEYSAKKGIDPLEDVNAFHEYVKKSIHVDVTSAQLSDKIRRLRKKYEKNASKCKEGVDRTFGKPHEQLSYDLSKKIWGSENGKAAVSAPSGGGFELKVNGKGKRTPKPNVTPDQKEKHASSLQIPKVVKNEDGRGVSQSLSSSFCFAELAKSKDAAALGLSEDFFKKGMDLLGDEVKARIEEKWKGLLTAELELYYKRLELTREQVKLVLDAHNK